MASITIADRRSQGQCSRTRLSGVELNNSVSSFKAKIADALSSQNQNYGKIKKIIEINSKVVSGRKSYPNIFTLCFDVFALKSIQIIIIAKIVHHSFPDLLNRYSKYSLFLIVILCYGFPFVIWVAKIMFCPIDSSLTCVPHDHVDAWPWSNNHNIFKHCTHSCGTNFRHVIMWSHGFKVSWEGGMVNPSTPK